MDLIHVVGGAIHMLLATYDSLVHLYVAAPEFLKGPLLQAAAWVHRTFLPDVSSVP